MKGSIGFPGKPGFVVDFSNREGAKERLLTVGIFIHTKKVNKSKIEEDAPLLVPGVGHIMNYLRKKVTKPSVDFKSKISTNIHNGMNFN